MKWGRDARDKRHFIIMSAVAALVLVIGLFFDQNGEQAVETSGTQTVTVREGAVTDAAVMAAPISESAVQAAATPSPEDGIYTYLQGPKSWKERREWSGKWGKTFYDGQSFGAFGCGFCCMANIYSSLTEYQCLPTDIYRYAKKVTYYPGGGAISWEQMQATLNSIGFETSLHHKPSTYKQFLKQVQEGRASLVLVSSANDSSYWKNTPGHYVTLFLYDKTDNTVFLADSGDPEHNRHRVSCKTIYKALKTSSDYHFMSIDSYNKEKDQWKHKGIKGNWVRPQTLED